MQVDIKSSSIFCCEGCGEKYPNHMMHKAARYWGSRFCPWCGEASAELRKFFQAHGDEIIEELRDETD